MFSLNSTPSPVLPLLKGRPIFRSQPLLPTCCSVWPHPEYPREELSKMTSTAYKPKNIDGNNPEPTRLNIKARENGDLRKEGPAVSGRELIDLLSPFTPESFTTEYWCRKPLFIKGHPKKLQQMFPGG